MSKNMQLASTSEIIREIARGRMVIVVDDEDRENEGDLVMAADAVTPQAINFMIREARGLVCLTLTEEKCASLGLPPMVASNESTHSTAFTVSIEAAEGVTTGISAHDRATTVLAAVAADAAPRDLVRPGHIFPLAAKAGGVLTREGHTEAGCDLAALAGRSPAAVICEIINDDGTMARLPDLLRFAEKHGLLVGTIRDLIEYRRRPAAKLKRVDSKRWVRDGEPCRRITYLDEDTSRYYVALVSSEPSTDAPVPVRVQRWRRPLTWLGARLVETTGVYESTLFGFEEPCSLVILTGYHPESVDADDGLHPSELEHLWDDMAQQVLQPIMEDIGLTESQLRSELVSSEPA